MPRWGAWNVFSASVAPSCGLPTRRRSARGTGSASGSTSTSTACGIRTRARPCSRRSRPILTTSDRARSRSCSTSGSSTSMRCSRSCVPGEQMSPRRARRWRASAASAGSPIPKAIESSSGSPPDEGYGAGPATATGRWARHAPPLNGRRRLPHGLVAESREMKPPDNGVELLREDRVHLTHRLLHALGLAHVEHLLEILDRGVDRDKLHASAAAILREPHAHLPGGELRVDVPVGVREGVLDVQRSWRVDRDDAPDPVEPLALRAGHEVADGAARLELV